MIKIRVSNLPFYLDCPRRCSVNLFWREIKEAGFKVKWTPKGISAAVGSGLHGAAGYIVNSIIHDGNKGKLEDATEQGIMSLKEALEEGAEYDNTTPNNNHAEKQIITLSRSYYHEVAPRLNLNNPSIEQNIKAKLDEDTIISGTPDLADEKQIRDLKTGRESSYHAQVGGYSLLRKSNNKPRPDELSIDFCPRVPIKKPYPGAYTIQYDVTFSEEFAFNIIRIIKRDIDNFLRTGDPWAFPPNPKSMLCGEKYCKAYKTNFCRLGGK